VSVAGGARAVMVLGTASNAGKSLVATALCRILARRDVRVAPFKAQNMSLNSAATPDGREIGRAQALQAEAAGLAPHSDMNPVLIKPTGNMVAQAIVNGRIWGTIEPRDFLGRTKHALWPQVTAAYDRLARAYDVIVIEGAGSPAEINLREHDIVNMAMAHYAGARCVLLADIDRGGAFAAVAGTLGLLGEEDRRAIAGYAFNKFRGDVQLLQPGIDMLAQHVAAAHLGTIPYLDTTGLDEEDGVCLERRREYSRPWRSRSQRCLRIAVAALPHLANFTDFDALEEEPSVDLRYVDRPQEMAEADVAILPGSKSTMADLRWLRERALDRVVMTRRVVIGICAGMQMLGSSIDDPLGVEEGGSAVGLGVFDLRSTFDAVKTTAPVVGVTRAFDAESRLHGYEIHVGVSDYGGRDPAFAQIERVSTGESLRDGAIAQEGRAIGTYVHGLFAKDELRHDVLRWARALCALDPAAEVAYVEQRREARLDALADAVERALNLEVLLSGIVPATA
jgi:adenosylcobyric acid synthase